MRCYSGSDAQTNNSAGRAGSSLTVGIIALVICFTVLFPCLASISSGGDQQVKGRRIAQDLLSVMFPNEQEGWACGRWGTILHSNDGGMSWDRQMSGVDQTLTSVSFADSKNGWVVGDTGSILHTMNGGETWEKQESPVKYYLMGVQFVSAQKGWAVGERTTILYTSDAGKTWQVQFKDEDYILKSVSFCDDKNGWAVGEYGLIYRTRDGGLTWEKQAGGWGISKETGELEGGNILFKVVTVNPEIAWAVGIDGFITKTIDGGANWQTEDDHVPKVHLFGLALAGDRVVIGGTGLLLTGLAEGSALKTADAEPKITYGWIYSIAPRGKAGFVAVGKGGCIYLADEKALQWRSAGKR